jgi:hypothetical protein
MLFPDAFGVEVFTYLVSDGKNEPVTGQIQVEVLPVPDAPVAVDDVLETTVDTPAVISRLVHTVVVRIASVYRQPDIARRYPATIR